MKIASELLCTKLTNLPLVWPICVSELGKHCFIYFMSPVRRQANIWANARVLSNGTLGKKFNDILIKKKTFYIHGIAPEKKNSLRNGDHFVRREISKKTVVRLTKSYTIGNSQVFLHYTSCDVWEYLWKNRCVTDSYGFNLAFIIILIFQYLIAL